MPVESELPTTKAPPQGLTHNPFRDTAREAVFEAIRSTIEGNSTQRRIATVSGIPIIQRTNVGASLSGLGSSPGESAAYASGRDFLIVRHSKGMLMIGLPAEFGLTPQVQRSLSRGRYQEGQLPELERLIRNYSQSSYSISAIYIGRPIDCLQLVNSAITPTGARRVNPSTGVDLAGALGQPGMAIARTRLSLVGSDRRTPDSEQTLAFVRDARPGDVMMFLARVPGVRTVAEARSWEAANGDHIVWLDAQNQPIDTRTLSPRTRPAGTPYHVRHTGVYAGLDNETQRPLVAQSHVNTGSISMGPLDTYLATGGRAFDAIAIVSSDYFAQSHVASTQ
ncbi:MAG: hypothetical protein V1861_03690 [Candidatus Micrarchaeota archaeon]